MLAIHFALLMCIPSLFGFTDGECLDPGAARGLSLVEQLVYQPERNP
jgi:hypothetical protein